MKRPYELLARFSPDGSVSGVSVRYITTVDGKDYESDPVPLSGATDPAFTAFASQFAAAAVAERDALRTQLQQVTTERDALRDQAALVPDLQSRVAVLETEKAALQAEVDRLTALVPPPLGPREVTAEEFLSRFSDSDRAAIGLSQAPAVILAQQELFTRSSRIDLDSPRLAAMVDALIAAGIPIDATERQRIFA